MQIVTGSDGKYRTIMLRTLFRANELEYPVTTFDFGALGYGTKFDVSRFQWVATAAQMARWHSCHPTTYAKPSCILKAMHEKLEDTVWLDADALLIGELDAFEDESWDVGLTSKVYWTEERDPTPNTGVVFFRGNTKSIEFLGRWAQRIQCGEFEKSDQHHLHAMLNRKKHSIGELWDWEGIKIKWLPEKYNVCVQDLDLLPDHMEDARVLHFFRKGGEERCRKWIKAS